MSAIDRSSPTPAEIELQAEAVVDDVLAELGDQAVVTSGQIAAEVLSSLRRHDPIAYLRFAIPLKRFSSAADFVNEVASLQRRRE